MSRYVDVSATDADPTTSGDLVDPVAIAAAALSTPAQPAPARFTRPRRRKPRIDRAAAQQIELEAWSPAPGTHRAQAPSAEQVAAPTQVEGTPPVTAAHLQRRTAVITAAHAQLVLDGVAATAADLTAEMDRRSTHLKLEADAASANHRAVLAAADEARRLLAETQQALEDIAETAAQQVAARAEIDELSAAAHAALTRVDELSRQAAQAQRRRIDAEVASAQATTARLDAERLLAERAEQAEQAASRESEALARADRASDERRQAEESVLGLLGHVKLTSEQVQRQFDEAAAAREGLTCLARDVEEQATATRLSLETRAGEAREALAEAKAAAAAAAAAHARTCEAESFAERAAAARAAAEHNAETAWREVTAAREMLQSAAQEARNAENARAETERASAERVRDVTDQLGRSERLTREAISARVEAERGLERQLERTSRVQDDLTAALEKHGAVARQLADATATAAQATAESSTAHNLRREAEGKATEAERAAAQAHRDAARVLEESTTLHAQMHDQARRLQELLDTSAAETSRYLARLAETERATAKARAEVLVQARARAHAEERLRILEARARHPWFRGWRRAPAPAVMQPSNAGDSPSAEQAPPASPDPAQDTATALTLTPRRAAHQRRVVACAVAIVGAAVAVTLLGSPRGLVVGAVLLGLALVRSTTSSRRATVQMIGSVVDIRRAGDHHVFDLADPALRAEVTGSPQTTGWRVTFHRRGLEPVVLQRRDVDAVRIDEEFRRWRGSAV